MVNNYSPNQPQNIDDRNKTFSDIIKGYLETRGITKAKFAKLCQISKSTVTKIIKNTNYKGTTYKPDVLAVMAICVGLKLTNMEAQNLFFTAFPEMMYLGSFLANSYDIDRANIVLYDEGLSILGNSEE